MKKIFLFGVLALFLMSFVVVAQEDSSNQVTTNSAETQTTTQQNQAKATQIQTQERTLTQTQIQKAIQTKNRIKANIQSGECPEDCTCTGSTMKCELENGGREMTITAGNSGNIIVQVKGVDMSTNVTLYKSEGKVYGVFKDNQTKEIKVMPDEVKEKIRQRTKARLENYNITLDEEGVYQVQAKKKARLFFLIPVREKVKLQINSETGEIIKMRNPWWGFLARDVEETIVGGCGTVTPGMEDECCQNLGYDFWNSETLECEIKASIDEVVENTS